MKSRKKSCLSDYYVVTKVFKNYKEFEIEKENGYKGNGISQKILDTFYSGSLEKAKKDNERNLGCWNCTNCTECYNCIECHMCSFCQWCNCCNLCLKCSMCSGKAKKITFHQNKNIYKTPASEIEKAIEYNCNNVRDY